ncbi:F-box domain-containing protein [Tolypocladium paradoxum]|uniref:F-box domain-containing protein n=1 Tax=Tolypocladium paradoxum TaxID=94208 RepID=A0A2S4L1P6_9HYPO|nr:F-box domain-containing protein [Tolypocladium paradoxum]
MPFIKRLFTFASPSYKRPAALPQGIRFQSQSGQEICLGYANSHCKTAVVLSPSSQRAPGLGALGFCLALDETGIKSVAVLMGDGTLSSWVGEHENIPKWCLVDDRGNRISSIKGEFDAFKLVSLSISTSPSTQIQSETPQRNIPFEISVSGVLTFLPNTYDLTERATTIRNPVLFGGPGGEDLSKLVEIAVWIFDVTSITGLEFVYSHSESRSLGRLGPYPHDMPRTFEPSDDLRATLSIDGPGGERVESVEVQEFQSHICGLKIRTNRGREGLFPPPPDHNEKFEWTPVTTSGNVVVGFYSIHSIAISLGCRSTIYGLNGDNQLVMRLRRKDTKVEQFTPTSFATWEQPQHAGEDE